jgi:hypothetical protein
MKAASPKEISATAEDIESKQAKPSSETAKEVDPVILNDSAEGKKRKIGDKNEAEPVEKKKTGSATLTPAEKELAKLRKENELLRLQAEKLHRDVWMWHNEAARLQKAAEGNRNKNAAPHEDGRKQEFSDEWCKQRNLYKTLEEMDFDFDKTAKSQKIRIRKAYNMVHKLLDGSGVALQDMIRMMVKQHQPLLLEELVEMQENSETTKELEKTKQELMECRTILDSQKQFVEAFKQSRTTDTQNAVLSLAAASKFSGQVTNGELHRHLGLTSDRSTTAAQFADKIGGTASFQFPVRKPRKDKGTKPQQQKKRKKAHNSPVVENLERERIAAKSPRVALENAKEPPPATKQQTAEKDPSTAEVERATFQEAQSALSDT